MDNFTIISKNFITSSLKLRVTDDMKVDALKGKAQK
jgi:hypothetical protein